MLPRAVERGTDRQSCLPTDLVLRARSGRELPGSIARAEVHCDSGGAGPLVVNGGRRWRGPLPSWYSAVPCLRKSLVSLAVAARCLPQRPARYTAPLLTPVMLRRRPPTPASPVVAP